jgi:hypothetical protein
MYIKVYREIENCLNIQCRLRLKFDSNLAYIQREEKQFL